MSKVQYFMYLLWRHLVRC